MDRRTLLQMGAAAALIVRPNGSQAAEKPAFQGQLIFEAIDEDRLMRLVKPYAFVDARGVRWEAPAGTLVDGASIPKAFWSIVGGPFDGPYRNASVLHDYYCDVRTRPWQQVHRMFHEAMLANKVDSLKAKLMYLAVYYGGPRWSEVVIRNMKIHQAQGATSKGGAEGIKDLGQLQRVPTGLGVDIAIPSPTQQPQAQGGASADYVIIAVERPLVDVYVFDEMRKATEKANLSLEEIEVLVEKSRLSGTATLPTSPS